MQELQHEPPPAVAASDLRVAGHLAVSSPCMFVHSSVAGHVEKIQNKHLDNSSQALFNMLQTVMSKTLSSNSSGLIKHQSKLWAQRAKQTFQVQG